ncbi:HIRAN domain-containing protein [Halarcobacter anaerophilus]|uniref:HIRAN domain-containing protein n=1 Tax=Halarcobacter anaerophilus TaxID=877500 RepID=A0A4Q0Y1E0_9BACT|nr:HIRAN domain-containing protein [Halarcobacter anaerophilus]QDF28546.1 HIRAN domain-containing protein [Halarcobacter anaerophilus]RXJ63275.1 hypothetical protein CRV06_06240 [Halarcobacter anaerophilus]
MFYPNLMEMFHPLIGSMTLEQKNNLKKDNSKFFDSIVEHFKLLLQNKIDNKHILEEIYSYQEEFSLEQCYFLTNINDRAKAITQIYLHYITTRVEPDKLLGICLFEIIVAGTSYVDGISEKIDNLKNGEKLKLDREKNNPYDKNAIKVLSKRGKLGYIPKQKNKDLIFLMEQDYKLFAILKRVVWTKESIKIKIYVYCEN